MRGFVVWMLVLFIIDIVGSLAWLGSGDVPQRTSLGVAIGCSVDVVFLVYGAVVYWEEREGAGS